MIAFSPDTPSTRVETQHYTKVMFLFINSIQQSWTLLLQSGASHELCLCLTKRPLKKKPCLVLPFDSSLLCRMLWWWFSPTRHLWQILQLGGTLFNLSIKTDFFEFLIVADKCTKQRTMSGWQEDDWTTTRNYVQQMAVTKSLTVL